MKVERKQRSVRQLPGPLCRGRTRVPGSLVTMVTLDHSYPEPAAHLFSTLKLLL
jgi:hypothetical protein